MSSTEKGVRDELPPPLQDHQQLIDTLTDLDAANAEDPNSEHDGGVLGPRELVYARRMTATLRRFAPEADALLHIAARAQHIQRWRIPRTTFPDGRVGYLEWRKALYDLHAEVTGHIMAAAGWDEDSVKRVGALLHKRGIKRDDDVQTLEDVACLVFLQHYFEPFAGKHDDAKLVDILRKTWKKMSPRGHEAAGNLTLSPRARELLARALAE